MMRHDAQSGAAAQDGSPAMQGRGGWPTAADLADASGELR